VYTNGEFEQELERLENIRSHGNSDDIQRATEDLGNIQRHLQSLQQILKRGNQVINFREFSEIAEPLSLYIASVTAVYAVKSIELYTSALSADEGVVFYDVPGLDSGLDITQEENARILQDCDAVILVKRAETPDLNEAEKKLAKYIVEGEVQVPISAKLFVFLNRIDQLRTGQVLSENVAKAIASWRTVADVNASRFISGSSLASLLKNSQFISEKTLNHHVQSRGGIDGRREILEVVGRVQGVDPNDAAAMDEACGIPKLKKQVHHFLENDRIDLLRQRCDPAIERIKRLARTIQIAGANAYGDDAASIRKTSQADWEIRFAKWVDEYLSKTIEKEIEPTFIAALDMKNAEAKLYAVYKAIIEKEIIINSISDPVKRKAIFAEDMSVDNKLEAANQTWREEIDEEMKLCIENLGQNLAIQISLAVFSVIEKMRALLWDDPKVEEFLIISREHYHSMLRSGVNALLLRFTRPLVNVFIAAPRETHFRKDVREKFERDLLALQSYAAESGDVVPPVGTSPTPPPVGNNTAQNSPLPQGSRVVPPRAEPSDRPNHANILERAKQTGLSTYLKLDQKPSPDSTETRLKWVTDEVESDVQYVRKLIEAEVFWASGVTDYRLHELRKLRTRYTETRASWWGITRNAWERRHPGLISKLPPNLKEVEPDLSKVEVFGELKQAIGL
jgi:hypothetical protein